MGLNDLIVVDTPDAILVANKEYVANIKSIVSKLEKKGFRKVLSIGRSIDLGVITQP